MVFGASLPPGVVAQQRPGPDPRGGQSAHQHDPPRHRRGAGPDPPPAARRGAHGDTRYFEPWARRRRPRPDRLSLQLTPYGTDLHDTRGMWQEFADVLPRIWTQEEISYDGTYYRIPRREVLPKPVQRPHPPLWSACGSDETARLTGSLRMGGLFGSEGGPDRVQQLMALYRDALLSAPSNGAGPAPRAALMTAGFCHED